MNVVPYIDVMLVLLVIFMISAPLLNQSVDVDLPNSNNAVDIETAVADEMSRPLVVSIDREGAYYIDRADDDTLPVTIDLIANITQEILEKNPQTAVYVRADKHVAYGSVMEMMDVLKAAGAETVGLITSGEDSSREQ